MTKNDTLVIITMLECEYPQSFSRMTNEQKMGKLALWADAFADDDPRLVRAAVKAIINGEAREFAPNIGQIKEKMHSLTNPDELTEAEAWNLVSKAIKNGIYGSKEEFSKLPEDIQRTVGSHNQLREWAMMNSETVQSVVASNFMRSYKVRTKRHRELQMLPPDVRNVVMALASGMSIDKALPPPEIKN